MDSQTFRDLISEICAYYERKMPGNLTLDLWFESVERIPKEPIGWIKTKLFQENDTKPSNLPGTLWALYNAWLQANPNKRAFREAVNCPDCEGGWLVLQKRVEGYRQPLSFSAPCGRCKQIPAANYMTIFQAREKGYERANLNPDPWDGKNVKEMAAGIGRPVPEARAYAD